MKYCSVLLWLLLCSIGGPCLLPQRAIAESVILWWEAEDAVDYTFPQGIVPPYMEVLERDNELSNRLGLQIATQTPPWDERGYFARYEVWIPHTAIYTLYIREAYVDEVFAPSRWRFDTHTSWRVNQWTTSIVLDQQQRTIGSRETAHRIDGGWVKYGEVTLTAGTHTLDLEALPDTTGRYAKLLDALVLATEPFTPAGKIPPPNTRFMHDLLAAQPVEVVLDPTAIVQAQMPRVHRGVALYMGGSLAGKEVYITAMKALGVNLSRLFRYHSSLYPVPRLDSSPQWPQLQTFLESRGLPSEQQRLLDYFTSKDGKGSETERAAQLRALLHFLETEGISFTQPSGDTWDTAIQAHLAVQEFGGVHLISHSLRFPRWLSSKPTADTLQTAGAEDGIADYAVFPPTDLRGYIALWKQDIQTLTRRVPGLVTYWEVHNEPDLDGFLRVPSDAPPEAPPYRKQLVDSYLQLYDAAAQAVREAGVALKLGGTSSRVLPDDLMIPRLIEHAQQTGQKLDFLSWHAYIHQPPDIKNTIKTVRAMLRKASLPQVELLIDEWNLQGGGGWTKAEAALFNSHFNAAFSAASLGAMIEAGLDRAVFFYDRDQKPQPNGRHFGLLTHDNRKKPVYFTFLMFERLGDVQLRLSFSSQYKVGGLATRRPDGTIVLLLWNYDLSQRVPRRIQLRRVDNHRLIYDRYLVDEHHTLLGANVMHQVADSSQDDTFTMPPNSVTLLSFRTGD